MLLNATPKLALMQISFWCRVSQPFRCHGERIMLNAIARLVAGLRSKKAQTAFEEAVAQAEIDWTPPAIRPIDARSIIGDWLNHCGLAKTREQDVEFYLEAFHDQQLNYRDIRKRGMPLSSDERKAIGRRGKSIVTAEFVDTLNDAGLQNPLLSAEMIARPASYRCHSAKDLARLAAHDVRANLMPSESLAGPCDAARLAAGRDFDPDKAPLLPLPQCTHPDQCCCIYRASLGD